MLLNGHWYAHAMMPVFSLRSLFAVTGAICALLALFCTEPTALSGLLVLMVACGLQVRTAVGLLRQGTSRFFWGAAFVPMVIATQTALDAAFFQRMDFLDDGSYLHVLTLVEVFERRRKIGLLWFLALLSGYLGWLLARAAFAVPAKDNERVLADASSSASEAASLTRSNSPMIQKPRSWLPKAVSIGVQPRTVKRF